MIELNRIQKRLRQVFNNSGLTQSELSQKINISQQALSNYLKGISLPNIHTFANLCAVIDEDPAYILCLKD